MEVVHHHNKRLKDKQVGLVSCNAPTSKLTVTFRALETTFSSK